MARCPRCIRSFRTLEDETDMHDCPHCGYGPDWAAVFCFWCNDHYSDHEFEPYCSSLCAARAQADSAEDDSCA